LTYGVFGGTKCIIIVLNEDSMLSYIETNFFNNYQQWVPIMIYWYKQLEIMVLDVLWCFID